MSEILTRLRGYNPPDRTEWSGVRIAQDISDAADEIDRLRLALETATREAEEERRTAEAAVKFLGRIAEVTWEAGLPSGDRDQTLKNVRALASRPAPPADAAREDAVTAWARLAVALLSRHESAWEHDPGPGEDDCDEDCRACEYVGLLRTGRAALSSPAHAPSTDPWRACGCPDPDDCEHVFRAPAPSAKEAEIRKHRSTLLQGLAFIARESWWPDDASVTDRVRETVAKMRDATDALSSPAPAPSAPAMRRCGQP